MWLEKTFHSLPDTLVDATNVLSKICILYRRPDKMVIERENTKRRIKGKFNGKSGIKMEQNTNRGKAAMIISDGTNNQ